MLKKWLIPVISYLVFLLLVLLLNEVNQLFFSLEITSENDVHFANSVIILLASPLILIGYIVLPIATWIYKKNKVGYWLFALMLNIVLVILLFLFDINAQNESHSYDWIRGIAIWAAMILPYFASFFILIYKWGK
jgi:hypothetical protein